MHLPAHVELSTVLFAVVAVLLHATLIGPSNAFLPPLSRPDHRRAITIRYVGGRGRHGGGGAGNGHENNPPPPGGGGGGGFWHDANHSDEPTAPLQQPLHAFPDDVVEDDHWNPATWSASGRDEAERNTNRTEDSTPTLRGGGKLKEKPGVVESTVSYWKKAATSVTSTLTSPFRWAEQKASNMFKSKEQRLEEELMETLKTTPIQRVTVPNTTVLPSDVVQIAARRSGLFGNPLQAERVQDLAETLKRWYVRKGYVLHTVTGATLKPESKTAEITVQEPIHHDSPVGITYLKEMVVDPDTGELISFKKYKERQKNRGRGGTLQGSSNELTKKDLNTTLVETQGRTNPTRIASAMGMVPGQPFQWDNLRWQNIAQSGLFSRIFHAAPQPMRDGTVQLHILATEAPTRHLEYGVGKSLYSGEWEGEMDFQHANLLGGGETLGLLVRRGTKDAEPSISLKYGSGRLELEGGYDIEAFREYVGDEGNTDSTAATKNTNSRQSRWSDYNQDLLVDRIGATFRVKNPIDTHTIRNSAASLSMERASTKKGLHETIGSTTVDVGPFLKELSMGARSNVDASFTTGARVALPDHPRSATAAASSASAAHDSTSVLPYASAAATTRQLFPLTGSPNNNNARPILLALKHTITASTPSLPRHVAKAIGTSTNIRGSTPNGRVSSALKGSIELRVPIQLPRRLKTEQDASAVLFGDWLMASKDPTSSYSSSSSSSSSSSIYRKSSVGIGLRKTLQGIPLQYDISYSEDGKMKTILGIGSDFIF